MIEVLFGESEAAAMKAARQMDRKELFEPKTARTAQGVICLGLMLDLGDIEEAPESEYRAQYIYSLYAQDQWGADPGMDQSLKRISRVYGEELRRLKGLAKEGAEFRIWYSDTPYEQCGFHHLCSVLMDYSNPVTAVKMPPYTVNESCITMYSGWREVEAESFVTFLNYEKRLTGRELKVSGQAWLDLAAENSPLRAMINGRLVSVREDFYDFLIWQVLTGEPVKQVRVIGELLGRYPLGVGDWWYAARIEYYITTGKIRVIEDSNEKYGRVIALA